jgi:hypothetical protein
MTSKVYKGALKRPVTKGTTETPRTFDETIQRYRGYFEKDGVMMLIYPNS